MTILEASQLVIQAGAMCEGGEIFVLDMGQPVKIVDLAKDMIRLSGLQVGKDIDVVNARIDLLRSLANGSPNLVVQELRAFIPKYQGADADITLRDAA